MERINKLLSKPERLSVPQKKLWLENMDMIKGKLDNLSPLQIRLHHYDDFYGLASSWAFKHLLNPWEHKQSFEEFYRNSVKLSLRKARHDIELRTLDFDENLEKTNLGRVLYGTDLIGLLSKHREAYFLSVFLVNMNFLLRANKNPQQLVYLSEKPDLICESCKGGHFGTGIHCKLSFLVPRKRNRDLEKRDSFLREIAKGSKEIRFMEETREIAFPIKRFFDVARSRKEIKIVG